MGESCTSATGGAAHHQIHCREYKWSFSFLTIYPMSSPIYRQIDPTIAAISTIMIVISTTLLVLAQVFGRGKQQS